MKLLYVFALLFVVTFSAKGQLSPTIGQFQYLQLYYNPAYAGSSSGLNANVVHRSQWTSLKGAPNTQLLTVEAPLGRNVGIGGVINRYKIGSQLLLDVNLNVSYRIKFDKETFFQFGLKAGMSYVNNNFDQAFVWDENDAYIGMNSNRGTLFRIGPGGYFKKRKFYIGVSSPDLLFIDPNKVFYDNQENTSTLRRNFFLITGIKKNINEFIAIEPSFMLRYYHGRPLNAYLNVGFEFNQTFVAGVSYGSPLSFGAFTRVSISPKLKIGYRYEFSNEAIKLDNYGSNEIQISYGFN
jgi:type IX secretion system PorP/SprF family membrane protein